MNRITVFRSRYISGWDGTESELEDAEKGYSVPLEQGLQRKYQTDAHFTCYVSPGNQNLPRLNKSALAYYRAHDLGAMPELRTISVDLDFPDHGSGGYDWNNTDQWPDEYYEWLRRITWFLNNTPEGKVAGTYRTRGGMRIVWPLDEDRFIPCTKAQSYLEQFHDYLEEKDLPCDRLTEFNRMFRLPRVVRDQTFQDWGMDLEGMDFLNWDPPEGLTESKLNKRGDARYKDMPNLQSLDKRNLSDLKPLKGYWFYRDLRAELPIAEEGERHNTVRSVAMTIVSEIDTTNPMVPFQLLKPSIDAMNQQHSDRLPYSEVWRLCVWCCEVHDGRRKANRERKRNIFQETAEAMDCSVSEVRQRLILSTKDGSSHYVWNEEKQKYAKPTSNSSMLIQQLKENCPRLSGATDLESMSVSEVLKEYSSSVNRVVYTYEEDKTTFDPETRTIYHSTLDVDPNLEPNYNPYVHEWLKLLGADKDDKFLDWLASFLELDQPTCAVYIDSPPGTGKGLLTSGVTRIFNTNKVEYEEVMGNFQGSLIDCPLIVADEKVPSKPFQENGSSIFRRLVGTGRMKVNRKYQAPADLHGFPRLLITANNANALEIKEAVGEDDIEAIQQRIGYIKTDSSPREYLRQTAKERGMTEQEMTSKWANGEIAKHILWLNRNRAVVPDERFIVSGWKSELTTSIALRFGAVPPVAKFVAKVIRDGETTSAIRFEDESIYANIGNMQECWNRVMSESSRVPADSTLMKAFKVLSGGQKRRFREGDAGNPKYFWKLDVDMIATAAEEFYLTTEKTIREVVKERSDSDTPSAEVTRVV